jgi:hypothetical protein
MQLSSHCYVVSAHDCTFHMMQGYGMPAAEGFMPAAPLPMMNNQHCQPFGTQFEVTRTSSYIVL